MQSSISFVLDDRIIAIDFGPGSGLTPTTTVLNYLRGLPTHRGVKEACAEGDCGACTVVLAEPERDGTLRYRAVDSCLIFLPMLHGKQLITVENLKSPEGDLHPVQSSMVEMRGSQCGYCTPGIVMSLFALYKSRSAVSRADIDDALTGNLCRCTGYKPIIEAAARSRLSANGDKFSLQEKETYRQLLSISAESVKIQSGTQCYYRPNSLTEALELRRRLPGAIVVNGGSDVALRVSKNHEFLPEIIDLGGIESLRHVHDDDHSVRIGAGVVLNDVQTCLKREFPALSEMLAVFGSRQIRNVATLGGNVGTGSPIGDTLPVLIAYGAKIMLSSIDGSRSLAIDNFYTGYRQSSRRPDELITGIEIPKSSNGAIVKGYKVSKRKDLDIATVSGGFRLELHGGNSISSIVLAYGGMAETVKRAGQAERYLHGKSWERETVEAAMELVDHDFKPISDARGSAEMRRIAARNLLLKFWDDTRRS